MKGEHMANKKPIKIIYLKEIEKIIATAVDPNDEGKFSSFREIDEITKSHVREIYNQLDELRAKSYLSYFLSKNLDKEGHVFSFLFDVIISGMDQDEWERERLV